MVPGDDDVMGPPDPGHQPQMPSVEPEDLEALERISERRDVLRQEAMTNTDVRNKVIDFARWAIEAFDLVS